MKEDKIREAFEKIYKIPENVEFCFGNYHEKKRHEWGEYALTKLSNEYSAKYQTYYLGYKSRQPEIESMKCCGNCGIEDQEDGECNIDSVLENGVTAFICDNWKQKSNTKTTIKDSTLDKNNKLS